MLNGGRKSGGGFWEEVANTVVSGGAVSYVRFSSLNLEEDQVYKLYAFLVGTANNASLNFFVNADTTGTNYYGQNVSGNAGTISGGRNNVPTIGYIAANDNVAQERTRRQS